MKIELSELQIRLVAYILGTHGSPTGRALSRKIQEQVTAQKNELQIVADVANDGPEVDLLRSFRIFPDGAHGGFELQKKKLMQQIYLTRRNLLTLLSKLDRVKAGGQSLCTLIKQDTAHPIYPCTEVFTVTAIEDEAYYVDRTPGDVLPSDDPKGKS